MSNEVKLNDQQETAVELVVDWFKNKTKEQQVFTLSGYAGTGKTFLINYMINSGKLGIEMNNVAFCAPTGKAASLLVLKGINATTVHALIYVATASYKEEKNEETGEVKKKKVARFHKKDELDGIYSLIIIDEVSMVAKKELDNLLSFKIPILCLGDDAQLPPVGDNNGLLDNPDFRLTSVVRQALDNPITRIATDVRLGKYIPNGNYGSVLIADRRDIPEESLHSLLIKSDQILCGSNKKRRELNTLMRRLKGVDVEKYRLPIKGEKMICLQNNRDETMESEMTLVNGMVGIAENVKYNVKPGDALFEMDFKPDFVEDSDDDYFYDLVVDPGPFVNENGEFKYDHKQKMYKNSKGEITFKNKVKKTKGENEVEFFKRLLGEMKLRDASNQVYCNRFDFGYVITVHKSQGSEYDKLTVFDESWIMRSKEDKGRWLYTAITRAKKKLVIIRN